jgi:hypothetical protein
MNQNAECSTKIPSFDNMVESFQRELRYAYVDEIVTETSILKELKHLYIKNMFNSMGIIFGDMYTQQLEYLNNLKKTYKDKYGQ